MNNPVFKPRFKHYAVFAGILAIDLLSKFIVTKFAPTFGNPIFNTGIAFSFFKTGSSSFHLLFLTSLISLFVILALLRFGNKLNELAHFGLISISAGGVANAIDRFAHFATIHSAAVTDFINWAGFFTGNFADIAVVIGAILLGVGILKNER